MARDSTCLSPRKVESFGARNPFRLNLIRELGFEVINPVEDGISAYVQKRTGTAGADVVFEVSGSAAGALSMTEVAKVRGRIVVVAVFGETPKVDLFRCFWRELEVVGARVYEPQDFDQAIELASSPGKLQLRSLITQICGMDEIEDAFSRLESGGDVMKVLIECS